jgi:hypothetical protein
MLQCPTFNRRASDFFTSSRLLKRSESHRAQYDIPAIRIQNGKAVLFNHYRTKKGKITIVIRFSSGVKASGVKIIIYLDGYEVGIWSAEKIQKGKCEFTLTFTVPKGGGLKAVLSDPHGHCDKQAVTTTIVPGSDSAGD